MASPIEELVVLLGFDVEDKGVSRFIGGLNKAKSAARGLASALKITALAAAAGVAAIGLAGYKMGSAIIKTSAQFEKFQTILTTLEGSSAKAKQSMDWISDFGAKTPYEIAAVTDAFVKLKSYGLDPINGGMLRILGDTASAMGKGLNQAVEALADASTGEFERLKEFGIKANALGKKVTFNWTENGKNMSKSVKKNGEDIRAALLGIFDEKFSGAMEAQSKTWNGMVSNMADFWQLFVKRIGDAGIFDKMKGILQSVLDKFGELADNGKLDEFATKISAVMENVVDSFLSMTKNITVDDLVSAFQTAIDMAGALVNVVKTVASAIEGIGAGVQAFAGMFDIDLSKGQAIVIAIGLIVAAFAPFVAVIAGVILAIDDIWTHFQGGESVFGDMIAGLKSAWNEFSGWLSSSIDSLLAPFKYVFSFFDKKSLSDADQAANSEIKNRADRRKHRRNNQKDVESERGFDDFVKDVASAEEGLRGGNKVGRRARLRARNTPQVATAPKSGQVVQGVTNETNQTQNTANVTVNQTVNEAQAPTATGNAVAKAASDAAFQSAGTTAPEASN